jgi:hypothetical protein
MKMMPARLARCGVNVATARREDPLPSECLGPRWRLLRETAGNDFKWTFAVLRKFREYEGARVPRSRYAGR